MKKLHEVTKDLSFTKRQDKYDEVKNLLNKALSFSNNKVQVFIKMNYSFRVISENICLNALFDHFGFSYAVTQRGNIYYYSLTL